MLPIAVRISNTTTCVTRRRVPIAAAQLFDYWVPSGLDVQAGSVVRVRIARRIETGVVVAIVATPAVDHAKLLPLEEVVAIDPVPAELLAQAAFVAGYYQSAQGEALCTRLRAAFGAGNEHELAGQSENTIQSGGRHKVK